MNLNVILVLVKDVNLAEINCLVPHDAEAIAIFEGEKTPVFFVKRAEVVIPGFPSLVAYPHNCEWGISMLDLDLIP